MKRQWFDEKNIDKPIEFPSFSCLNILDIILFLKINHDLMFGTWELVNTDLYSLLTCELPSLDSISACVYGGGVLGGE